MSAAHFLKGITDSLLSDRQRAKQAEWDRIKQQEQFDLIQQQAKFRAALQEKSTPPSMREFRNDEGGLMQVPSRWNSETQSFDDFGEAQPVPVARTGTRTIPVGSEKITYDEFSDGTRKEVARANAFAPTSSDQTPNSIAVDRRADQRRADRARRDAINFVKGMEAEEIEKMGGRESAIEKMQRQFLGEEDGTPKGPSVADITPKGIDLVNKGAKMLGLMGADEAADPDGTTYKAVDQSGKPTTLDAKDREIAKIIESPEFQRAPMGKTFDIQGEKWVKTERGLEPAGAEKAKRPDAEPEAPNLKPGEEAPIDQIARLELKRLNEALKNATSQEAADRMIAAFKQRYPGFIKED